MNSSTCFPERPSGNPARLEAWICFRERKSDIYRLKASRRYGFLHFVASRQYKFLRVAAGGDINFFVSLHVESVALVTRAH